MTGFNVSKMITFSESERSLTRETKTVVTDYYCIDTAFSLACKYGPLPLIKIFLRSSQNDKVKEPWTLEITEYTIPGLNAEEIEELEELEFLERRTLRKRRIVRKNIFVDMCGSGRVELVSSLMDDIEKFGINMAETI